MAVTKINSEEFKIKIGESGKVIVDCYADWCGPCQMISPIIDELSNEMDTCNFYKLNVDEAEDIAGEYEIMSIPTILIFKEGSLVKRVVGFHDKEQLKEIIEKI